MLERGCSIGSTDADGGDVELCRWSSSIAHQRSRGTYDGECGARLWRAPQLIDRSADAAEQPCQRLLLAQ